MLYGEELHVIDGAIGDASLATAIALEAAAGAKLTKTMLNPGVAVAFGFRPTVAFDYDTQTEKGVLKLYKYPGGDSGNKVELASINLEDGDLAGTIYKTRVSSRPVYGGVAQADPKAFYEPGDQLAVEVTTQAAGGGYIAGDFQPFIVFANRGGIGANYEVDRTPAETPSY
jgi:hypothetical protein